MEEPAGLEAWPRVTVIMPARNEAEGVARSIGSLLRQDYPGEWAIILVDDDSSDGTGELACSAGRRTLDLVDPPQWPAACNLESPPEVFSDDSKRDELRSADDHQSVERGLGKFAVERDRRGNSSVIGGVERGHKPAFEA